MLCYVLVCCANKWFTLLFSCIALLVVSSDTALVATGAPSSAMITQQEYYSAFLHCFASSWL